jgi:hypothetical protein
MGLFGKIAKVALPVAAGALLGPGGAAAAGGVMSAVGQGKAAQQAAAGGGLQMDPATLAYLTGPVLNRVEAYGDQQYQGPPMRRVDMADLDPVFGSKARQNLQTYADANGGLYGDRNKKARDIGMKLFQEPNGLAMLDTGKTKYSADQYAHLLDAAQDGWSGMGLDDLYTTVGQSALGMSGGSQALTNAMQRLLKQYPMAGAK